MCVRIWPENGFHIAEMRRKREDKIRMYMHEDTEDSIILIKTEPAGLCFRVWAAAGDEYHAAQV